MASCKDCGSTTKKLTYAGPRCAGCWRTESKRRKAKAHDKRMCEVYGLNPGEYVRILEAQNFACAVCLKQFPYMLDLDHDHKTGIVRGLLCKSDNRKVLPYAKDDPKRLRAAAEYLENPPAVRVLGIRKAPSK